MTVSTFAADSYYSNAADEAKGKAEYNLLQKEIHQTAKRDQERRKKLNAREGDIVLTNDEIDQRLALLGKYITHTESKKAIDFVNNAKIDEYVPRQVDDVNMDGFQPLNTQPQEAYQYKFGEGSGVDENELFNPNLGRQK
jgi:hypothetical protein